MEGVTKHIDINCDVGEGIGNEEILMPLIQSCNIACGGHAGSKETMQKVIRLALKYDVKIGAHPSYPDKENFGRKSLNIEKEVLSASIVSQLKCITSALLAVGGQLHHIKAHGALYNDIAAQNELAEVYLNAVKEYRSCAVLFAPCGSKFAKLAIEAGFTVWEEAFADRAYLSNGGLASRNTPGSVLTDPLIVWEQIRVLLKDRKVKSVSGEWVKMTPKTYCIHGDTDGAHKILIYINQKLKEASFKGTL
jgi:UPF0271 protein